LLSDDKMYDTLPAVGAATMTKPRRNGVASRKREIRLTEIRMGTEAAPRRYRLAPPCLLTSLYSCLA